MKKVFSNLFLFGIVFSVSLEGVIHTSAASVPLVFDHLFPRDSFTKIHDHCIYVWGTLDAVIQDAATVVVQHDRIDVSIAQLFFATEYMEQLLADKTNIAQDNLIYLGRIVGTIEARTFALPRTIDEDKRHFFNVLITKLKKQMTSLLQANDARTGSCH